MTVELGTVVDLFSGAGGISYGFAAHPSFRVVAAADVELGKPSTGHGAIGCNATYEANVAVTPLAVDLAATAPADVVAAWKLKEKPTILLACPPCTGFSRAVARNYVEDDPRNSLVAHVADYAEILEPQIIFMENVQQLINGNFRKHYDALVERLNALNYDVLGEVHSLDKFGLPQKRERALVVAVKRPLTIRTLRDLWAGNTVEPLATSVRRAISHLRPISTGQTDAQDPAHTCGLLQGDSLERIRAIPHDGGSWPDLLKHEDKHKYIIPSMWTAVKRGRPNSYRDIYGRMAWDRPAATIKRECSHVGNGRYAHPDQDRPCSVRELALLQGFPESYVFVGSSRKNLYRHIGDAVPPLVSFQLACLAEWILTGSKPPMSEIVLKGTSLTAADITENVLQDALTLF